MLLARFFPRRHRSMTARKFRCLRSKAKPWKKAFASHLRRNMTWPEKLLWERIRDNQLGVSCQAQSVVRGWILDFWIPKLKICIEIDGPSHLSRRAYDRKRDAAMKKRDIITMRFKNEEVICNRNAVLSLILACIRQRTKSREDK